MIKVVGTLSARVSKQVAEAALDASEQLAYWQHPDNSDSSDGRHQKEHPIEF